MPQSSWINLAVDTSTTDPGRQKHISVGGASGSADATLAYDPVKLNFSLNTADAVLAAFRQRLIGSGFK